LAGFQSTLKEFEDEGIKIVAGSVDPLNKTEEFVGKLGLSFPVAYGMDMEATCVKTGAFYEKDRKFIQPACFLIRPNKTIEVAAYSSGPIGRFVPQDVLNLVRFYKSRAQK
jgi:peroxiredoxin